MINIFLNKYFCRGNMYTIKAVKIKCLSRKFSIVKILHKSKNNDPSWKMHKEKEIYKTF